ncbi:rhamnogalacturonate lyase c [Paramyrothecium foliicola]|nr:rhamnogalacturonate lyase c [Paramyrothecium foliicola]
MSVLPSAFDEFWTSKIRRNLKMFHLNLDSGKWQANEALLAQDYYWNYDGSTFVGPKNAGAALGFVADGPLRGLQAVDVYNIVDGDRGAVLLQISGKQNDAFAGLKLQENGLFNVKEAELLVFNGDALARSAATMTPIALMKQQMQEIIAPPAVSQITLRENPQTSQSFRQRLRQTMVSLHLNVNTGKASANANLATEDVEIEFNNEISRGRDAFVFHDAEIMADGMLGAIEYIWQATQEREYPGIGLKEGSVVKVRGMLFFEFNDEEFITKMYRICCRLEKLRDCDPAGDDAEDFSHDYDAKIIIIPDGSSGSPEKLNWDDLDLKKSYSLHSAADHCVSMSDAMVQHYAAQESAAGSGRRYFLHNFPGIVLTNIGGNLPWHVRVLAEGLSAALGVAPEECAVHMLRGSEEVAAAAETDGRFFGYVDRKGKAVPDKPVWTEEQRKKVAEHTWRIVDDALKTVGLVARRAGFGPSPPEIHLFSIVPHRGAPHSHGFVPGHNIGVGAPLIHHLHGAAHKSEHFWPEIFSNGPQAHCHSCFKEFAMVALTSRLTLLSSFVASAAAALQTSENATHLTVSNDRFAVALARSSGHIVDATLDGQDLLGPQSGNSGKGPYLDCSCTPAGFWTPGSTANLQLITGTDSTGTEYAGLVMSDTYKPTNQTLSQYFFLRDGETGLHAFSRVTYFNASAPFLRGLGEMRTLFRPNTPLWTHFSTSKENYGPFPSRDAFSKAVTVQDATSYVGNSASDPYVTEYSDYFTKYTLSESWRNHDVHGQFSDGSTSVDGNTYGAWLVHNTVETYYGGPLHSDLVVDGIVYNYMVAGHHGAPVPNITHGFDRTWGPQYYHFNKGTPETTLEELRADAAQYADPEWNAQFYDDIAEHVPNFKPSDKRVTFEGKIDLPEGAKRPIIVLSENKQDFQLNVFNTSSYQYWAEVDASGSFRIPRVVSGTYRVTIYADDIFGWFIQDDVKVSKCHKNLDFDWSEESAGKELWRIGVPDKSAGEYLHGYAPDTSKPLQPEQYRIYWANWDFPTDFPEGVNFHVGESSEAKDMNYIHWAFFPSRANHRRTESVYENVNNWTITFDLEDRQLANTDKATFTVQVAGTKTANGNNKWAQLDHPYSNLPWTVNVNGVHEETWSIPYWRSGSCGVRSAVACQNIEHKFVFPTENLKQGRNEFVLSLPYNASSIETALLPEALYIQYDAFRLEVS